VEVEDLKDDQKVVFENQSDHDQRISTLEGQMKDLGLRTTSTGQVDTNEQRRQLEPEEIEQLLLQVLPQFPEEVTVPYMRTRHFPPGTTSTSINRVLTDMKNRKLVIMGDGRPLRWSLAAANTASPPRVPHSPDIPQQASPLSSPQLPSTPPGPPIADLGLQIMTFLKEHPLSKAYDIAKFLGIEKSLVNKWLYDNQTLVKKTDDAKWSMI